MKFPFGLIRSVISLGIGEVSARFLSFLFLAYISRKFGVGLLGAVALAQTASMYVTAGTDQGAKWVGARIIARHPSQAPVVIHLLTRMRVITGGIFVAAGACYALFGPLPESARIYVLGFVLAVIPYALTLDWLAWGLGYLGWLATWRAGVALIFVGGAVLALELHLNTVLSIVLSNGVSSVAGAILLWSLWRYKWQSKILSVENGHKELQIDQELRWRSTLPLGIALMLSQLFQNLDTMLLGAMSTANEVGRYNGAYRILMVAFGGYYVLTQSLYPRFAGAKFKQDTIKYLFAAVAVVFLSGALLAGCLAVYAGEVLKFIYGSDLGAVSIFRVLAMAIPMEFASSLMGVMLSSRGFDRKVLLVTAIAAALNLILNLIAIPQSQAFGAAWATVVSYIVLTCGLLLSVWFASCHETKLSLVVSTEI